MARVRIEPGNEPLAPSLLTDPEEWHRRVQGVVSGEVTVELLSGHQGIAAEPASPLCEAIDATIAAGANGGALTLDLMD